MKQQHMEETFMCMAELVTRTVMLETSYCRAEMSQQVDLAHEMQAQ
jgi:hypothetical protein